jgi:DNA-binding transcriptional ArsR family regulator
VSRSKLLPSGGEFHRVDLVPTVRRLRDAVDAARRVRRISRDAAAEALWAETYPVLVRRRGGVFASVTARAESQVMRVAMIYALLDGVSEIRVEHLRAGMAVWAYCEETAWYLWGESTGDRDADRVLAALREEAELTRNEIRGLFSSHGVTHARLDRALEVLQDAGLVRQAGRRETGGRPAEVWESTGGSATAIRDLLNTHNPQNSHKSHNSLPPKNVGVAA